MVLFLVPKFSLQSTVHCSYISYWKPNGKGKTIGKMTPSQLSMMLVA